jgi:signal transduction histidine kinase
MPGGIAAGRDVVRTRRAPWASTSTRFALLHALLSLACTIPVLVYVYRQVDAILLSEFTRPLEFRQSNLDKQYRIGGIPRLKKEVESRAARVHHDQTAILLVDPAGRRLAGNLAIWPTSIPVSGDWVPAALEREGVGHSEQFLVRAKRLPTGHRLLLGGLLDNRAEMQHALLTALAAALALAIPIGLVGGFALARQMNRMVVAIGDLGEQVSAGDLARRAATDGSGDPVDRLKTTLNRMLDRIQALVEEHRVLTDALAHDLRSPLTRISMQLAGASQSCEKCDHAERFDMIGQEVDGVLHILESALQISRAEAGAGKDSFEPVDVTALMRDLGEIYEPLAVAADIRLKFEGEASLTVHGDRVLLARAVSNLVDNAIKYGAEGREILLRALREEREVRLEVSDRSRGIPVERQAEALRKFGRLDHARSTPGSGLGLTLVNAVASLHGGSFHLLDHRPGLRAVIRLPTL